MDPRDRNCEGAWDLGDKVRSGVRNSLLLARDFVLVDWRCHIQQSPSWINENEVHTFSRSSCVTVTPSESSDGAVRRERVEGAFGDVGKGPMFPHDDPYDS